MTLKRSRFGQFFACTGYPECKNTKDPKLLGTPAADEKTDRVDALFSAWNQPGSPGASVAIVRDGRCFTTIGF